MNDQAGSTAARSTAASAGKISVAIAISRALGLVREMVLAKYFGAGLHTDAFYIAYRIPNLLRDLFAEGSLSAAFLPTFTRRLSADGKNSAWLLANRLINTLLILLGATTLIFFFGAKFLVYLQAASFADVPGKVELTAQMIRILSPFLLCVSLAAVFMGMLNAFGSFFLPAMASSVFNICCILAGIFLSPLMPRWGMEPVVSMAVGALVGGFGQFAVMLPAARARGWRHQWTFRAPDFSDPDLRRIGKLMLPAVLGLSATQINIIVDSQLAAMYGDGPVSWLSYAFRLMQLPIGVFGVAIATVAAADASRFAALKDYAALGRTLSGALRLAACLTFPATVGLVIFRREIVQLLFQRGEFLPAHTVETAHVLLYYAFALFSYSAVKIMVPAFYALEDSKTPVRLSVLTVVVKIALNLLLMKPLGFLGLAASTTIASWLNFALLWRQISRAKGYGGHGGHEGHGIVCGDGDKTAYLRIAAASVAMGLFAKLVFAGSGQIITSSGTVALGLRLGLGIAAGVATLLPLLHLFRVREAGELRRMAAKIAGKFR
jgi:putative peptidoglycan lipid II flippase